MGKCEALAQLMQAYEDYPCPPDQEAYKVVIDYVAELEKRDKKQKQLVALLQKAQL